MQGLHNIYEQSLVQNDFAGIMRNENNTFYPECIDQRLSIMIYYPRRIWKYIAKELIGRSNRHWNMFNRNV